MRSEPKSLFAAPLDGEFLTRDQAKALAGPRAGVCEG